MTAATLIQCAACTVRGHHTANCPEKGVPVDLPEYADTWDGTGREGHPGFRIDYSPEDADPRYEVVVYGYLTEEGHLIRTQLLIGDDQFVEPSEARRLAAELVKAADEIERLDPGWGRSV